MDHRTIRTICIITVALGLLLAASQALASPAQRLRCALLR